MEDLKLKVEDYMKLWGFPSRFINWEKHMLDAKLQRLLAKCLQEKGVYMFGATGSGKTCFATVLAKELIKLGKECWFKNIADLMFEIKSTFDNENKILNDYGIICEWAQKEYLVLDDLGSQKDSEYVRQSLYVLVNKRYLEDMPTFVTSNLAINSLGERLDSRISSRLNEMCLQVDFGSRDLRGYKSVVEK